MANIKPWIVLVDGEVVERHSIRAAARAAKRWYESHPSTRDLKLFHGMCAVRVVSQEDWRAEAEAEEEE